MSEQIKQAITLLTVHLRGNDFIDQRVEDEICNLLGYDVESGPEIPAGWEVMKVGVEIPVYSYYFDVGYKKWCFEHHSGDALAIDDYIHIRQTINIDLDKQPKELVAFAMDYLGDWCAYDISPVIIADCDTWQMATHSIGGMGTFRKLMDSEKPTNFSGNWKASLLVRPEAMNGEKS